MSSDPDAAGALYCDQLDPNKMACADSRCRRRICHCQSLKDRRPSRNGQRSSFRMCCRPFCLELQIHSGGHAERREHLSDIGNKVLHKQLAHPVNRGRDIDACHRSSRHGNKTSRPNLVLADTFGRVVLCERSTDFEIDIFWHRSSCEVLPWCHIVRCERFDGPAWSDRCWYW